jgi:hypothetical protein
MEARSQLIALDAQKLRLLGRVLIGAPFGRAMVKDVFH